MRTEVLTANQFDCYRLTGHNIINEQLPITHYESPNMKRSACLIFNPVAGNSDPDQDLAIIQKLLEPFIDLDIRLTTPELDADRIARETRKVLRLAGWDLRERFRAALDQSEAERREVEASVAKSRGALTWLEGFERDVRDEKDKVASVVV